ncbi:YdhK family protein [Paenibacillus chibensis]|uniref:YdhK family protein n=1 Tax=Paenibacillus chibensis TaxID=59846 RepID=A0ABU6PZG6_9BACL|nr:YdhK family protein [Paenibacillus chibensis]
MKKQIAVLGIALMVALSGCGNDSKDAASDSSTADNSTAQDSQAAMNDSQTEMDHSGMDQSEMNHSGSSEVPQGLRKADNPAFRIGSQAVMSADHMPGMKGATATIVGAYDTMVYAVNYTPTTGGEPVKNHKWVIQEELKNAGDKPFAKGDHVVLESDHMKGMKGAEATIESAERTTVYMVDYTPTTGGEPVKNHKWVTESELSAK